MAFLVVEEGPHPGRRIDLIGEKSRVGRSPDCQIVLDVGAVSRYHAELTRRRGAHFVQDLNSRNHTFANEQDIHNLGPVPLRHGDRIRICAVTLVFHEDSRPLPAETKVFAPNFQDQISFEEDSEDPTTPTPASTIMSRLNVDLHRERPQLVATFEAKFNALLEITRALGRAVVIEDVLGKVLDALFRIFLQADRGFIALKSPDGQVIPRWLKARREDQRDRMRISKTIVKQVIEQKEAILSADIYSDKQVPMSESIAEVRIRSMMCVPLLDSEGTPLGVIQLDTLDQSKRFQQNDLEVLTAVAAQAGIAIDNAQLHENALKQQAYERELELARDVQKGFLPDSAPVLAGYEFFSYYEPANHVGGDYFDYVLLPDGRLAVVVADVVGHGVAAALMMAKLSAEVRYCVMTTPTPADAVTLLNDRLSGMQTDRFVTLILVVLDPAQHVATIVSAGHMAPIHRRVHAIEHPGEEAAGMPLGITDGLHYEQHQLRLEPGESLALYTDGINEAMDPQGGCFGIERICGLIQESDGQPEQTGRMIIETVWKFIGGGIQSDDMCLVILRRTS